MSENKETIKSTTIPKTRVIDGVVYYIVNVSGTQNSSWSVNKRYSQFEELHNSIILNYAKMLPIGAELPAKRFKLFVSHLSAGFIEERRCLLEAYLRKLVSVKDVAKSDTLISFFNSDKTEKEADNKETDLPDDVEITGVTIPATRTMSDHVLYQIDVVNARKRKSFQKWTVLKRFAQFFEMDQLVRADFVEQLELLESLPPAPKREAKLLSDHMDDSFIEQRRVLLENYLQKMLHVVPVAHNEHFLAFLGVNV